MRFSILPLLTARTDADVLACWELTAFFLGEASADVLDVDEQQAKAWYIRRIVDESEQAAYEDEDETAIGEMLEHIKGGLRQRAREHRELLGDHYPFSLNNDGRLVRKNRDQLTSISLCYLALQFFRALSAGYIEILGNNRAAIEVETRQWRSAFADLFEYIAGYAVAGDTNGAPYPTGSSRSAGRLFALLTVMCAKIGAGRVLPLKYWNTVAAETNDGRVDCLVHVGGPGMPGPAYLTLIGATVQRDNIDAKIMGPERLHFFAQFFQQQPGAFRGALVIHRDHHQLTNDKCVRLNCSMYSYLDVLTGIGKIRPNRFIRQMDAAARHLLHEIRSLELFHDEEVHGHELV